MPAHRHLPRTLALAVLMFLATGTLAATCNEDDSSWVPGRYYPPGAIVFHDRHWYRSRQHHEGKEPGTAFEWQKQDTPPDCANPSRNAERQREITGSTPAAAKSGPELEQKVAERAKSGADIRCDKPEAWQFSESYSVGRTVTHDGQTWRAIRPSNGNMPGFNQPPRWQPADILCQH